MRAPLSWLREYVDLPATETGRDVATRLIDIGLEVETVERLGEDLKGPLVVGRVLAIEELTGFRKPIRYCQVDVADANGTGEPQNIVCGATNFQVGDQVVVILPGGVLPGNFQITARTTYGHLSEGMICSTRELGIGDDHDGIVVLPPEYEPGQDAVELLELVDEVLDIAVTPDRGYCLSMRGLAREVATAYGLPLRDPALLDVPEPNDSGPPVRVAPDVLAESPPGCDHFVGRAVADIDPQAHSPIWLRRRVQKAGMRPLSLAVDVTNYVMLELGQPLHAYDRAQIAGAVGVRRAQQGERLRTLDGVERALDAEDLLITDDRGPIGLAGVMGGADTGVAEVGGLPEPEEEPGQDGQSAVAGADPPGTREVIIEAAHFDPVTISRAARRHKLTSEASRRFERGVDPETAGAAAQRVVDLLVLLADGNAEPGVTEVRAHTVPPTISLDADHPDRIAGVVYGRETVVRRLQQVGCAVYGTDRLTVTPPSWRSDLTDPNDLAEEVIRLEGYRNLPSTMPMVPPGRGLSSAQRLRRRASRALATAGYVEAPAYPFLSDEVWDTFGLEAGDERRRTVHLVNPLSDAEPALRSTLLPGLLGVLRRNVGRGATDLALFETGMVSRERPNAPAVPRVSVQHRPSDEEIAALDAALPEQPRYVAAVLCGAREPAGWWGEARPAGWADAIEAARDVAYAVNVRMTVRQAECAPWHPGRCAALVVPAEDGAERVVGHAGELHPRVLEAMHLPARTCAMELDFDALMQGAGTPVQAARVSTFPVATQDVALLVDAAVPADSVETALRAGAGELLESVRLFDVFTGEQLGADRKSLAYALRFRAQDRTLTAEETTAARDAAVAEAQARTGAVLRGA